MSAVSKKTGKPVRFTVASREGNCFDLYCNEIRVDEINGPQKGFEVKDLSKNHN